MTIKTASNNEPQLKVELTRDRNVSFGLANYQITETKSNGLSGRGVQVCRCKKSIY